MKPSAQYQAQVRPSPRPTRLTPRELEVLALLCEGLPNKLISRRLEISAATVKCHISRILSELRVSSRLQAVVAAQRHGLVNDSEQESNGVRSSLTAIKTATRGIRLVGGMDLLQ
jgi:DNA-binding NarL/FixJ family response regulator